MTSIVRITPKYLKSEEEKIKCTLNGQPLEREPDGAYPVRFRLHETQTIELATKSHSVSFLLPHLISGKAKLDPFEVPFEVQDESGFIQFLKNDLQIVVQFFIDFTGSNGPPDRATSLHYRKDSQYAKAIRAIADILAPYDFEGDFEMFGFGGNPAGESSVNHCFSLGKSSKKGTEGALELYFGALDTVGLSSPTHFEPSIREAMKTAAKLKQKNGYEIQVILTDGGNEDTALAQKATAQAQLLPYSLIIIGVGDGDFGNMEKLDGDQKTGIPGMRDVVQFVPMRKYRNIEDLTTATLQEIPAQLVGYMTTHGSYAELRTDKDETKVATRSFSKLSLSVSLVSSRSESQVDADVRDLYNSGKDKTRILRLLVPYCRYEVDRQVLMKKYKKEHGDLMTMLDKVLKGNLKRVVDAFFTPSVQYDADLLRAAMKGAGTDEDVLSEVLCARSQEELALIKTDFTDRLKRDLAKDVKSETSGLIGTSNYCKLLLAVLNHKPMPALSAEEMQESIEKDIKALYDAGEGRIGTDEKVFIEIFGGKPRPYVEQVCIQYGISKGTNILTVIKRETSGNFEKALHFLATPLHIFFAEQFNLAMKGAGTDDKLLIRTMTACYPRCFKETAVYYLSAYKRSLRKDFEGDTSGEYRELLTAMYDSAMRV